MPPSFYGSGAVYNHYLDKLKYASNQELEVIVHAGNDASIPRKIIRSFNPFVDYALRTAAATDIIKTRQDPNGEIGKKVAWKLEQYRQEYLDREQRKFKSAVYWRKVHDRVLCNFPYFISEIRWRKHTDEATLIYRHGEGESRMELAYFDTNGDGLIEKCSGIYFRECDIYYVLLEKGPRRIRTMKYEKDTKPSKEEVHVASIKANLKLIRGIVPRIREM